MRGPEDSQQQMLRTFELVHSSNPMIQCSLLETWVVEVQMTLSFC